MLTRPLKAIANPHVITIISIPVVRYRRNCRQSKQPRNQLMKKLP